MSKRARVESQYQRRSGTPSGEHERIRVEFQPEDTSCLMTEASFEQLVRHHNCESSALPPSYLERSFGAAAFFACRLDAAHPHTIQELCSRPVSDVHHALVASVRTAPRCSRHGPFGCSCTYLQLLGVLMRNLVEAFVEGVGDDNMMFTVSDAPLGFEAPAIAVVVHPTLRTVRLYLHGPNSFPFLKVQPLFSNEPILTLTKWDSLSDVEVRIREGWAANDSGFWKHQGYHMPTCAGCSSVVAVSASCGFCSKLFCQLCTSICPSCDFHRCCSMCIANGVVLERVPVRHCPECAAQPSAKDGYIVTESGALIWLKQALC